MIAPEASEPKPILDVRDLSVSFEQYARGLQKKTLRPITSLSVTIRPGEVLAVVGSSGSGKSLLAHAILGILPSNARVTGTLRYANENLTPERQVALRGSDIALVPQSVGFLNPLMRVGAQVRSAAHNGNAAEAQRAIFARYRLAPEVAGMYPFQLSGGMTRRVLVSTAMISGASLIIADEPTPGMHSAVVEETLGHLRELAGEGRAVMLITHDIEAALTIADRIAVLYAGTTVEIASVADFTGDGQSLRHPYSKALWRALPQNGFAVTPGAQPVLDELPPGCLYEPRCPMSTPDCTGARPEVRALRGGVVRCFHAA
ncbi:MAG: ABC transporter ATP-binding protein [Eubacteriales bacterium]|nr:ABC transporter ATP-binding protein [Bacillota bacterium]MDQ7790073.1 ABC transporter ATP-binding protein [Clostridia bacterium]MDZ4043863.1 ABC transporter ATP-binding protein [Eubacteriales bacterium]MDZ7610164.1 ABC transporter ATP-binding protein [Eubacteriales bacterium]